MSRIVAVTGAGGALGGAVVARLRQDGWTVVGVHHGQAPDARSIGGVDLTDEGAVSAVGEHIRAEHGRLDGLVNVAGGFAWETVGEGNVATWDGMYEMNVKTALVASKGLLPLLQVQGGAIVNVGAAGAVKAGAGMGAYAASKAGVARLTEAMAEELKEAGVRVNAVLPSIIDTGANRRDMPDADFGKWVTPEQLAAVIAFLLSDQAEAVTGALVPVTGRV